MPALYLKTRSGCLRVTSPTELDRGVIRTLADATAADRASVVSPMASCAADAGHYESMHFSGEHDKKEPIIGLLRYPGPKKNDA